MAIIEVASYMVEHNDVAGSRPRRSEEKRVVGVKLRIFGNEYIPPFEHGGQFVLLRNTFVCEGLLLLSGDARSLGIHQ